MPAYQKKSSILHNLRGEPDQLLIIQWTGAVLLALAIIWNFAVDAYLGHEVNISENGSVSILPTRYRPISAETVLLLMAAAGGAGGMYNWRRGQDRRHEIERLKITPHSPTLTPTSGSYARGRNPSKNPLDTDPGDPDARI